MDLANYSFDDDDFDLSYDDSQDENQQLEVESMKSDNVIPITIVTREQLKEKMNNCIQEVKEIIDLSPTTVRLLLNHFNWDKRKLLEVYCDCDVSNLFKDAGIGNPTAKVGSGPPTLDLIGCYSSKDCQICYTQMKNDQESFIPTCGHGFCRSCWKDYLSIKINSDGVDKICCPAYNCSFVMDDDTIEGLVVSQDIKQRFRDLILDNFIRCNKRLSLCPGIDCKNVLSIESISQPESPAVCSCGTAFCFECGNDWHEPIDCLMLKKWIKTCEDDSQTAKWINAFTKNCPKCSATIEKNGGCNHMVCTQNKCNYQFCWHCLGKWPHIRFDDCNRYQPNESEKKKSQISLQRYIFYYNRYMNHMQSLKLEHRLNKSIEGKMEDMQKIDIPWIDVQFLKNAMNTLIKCRQTLMYTYAFAFYLERNNNSLIFEDNQSDLEASTETLSGYLEREVTPAELSTKRKKIINAMNYCESRRRVLINHVHE